MAAKPQFPKFVLRYFDIKGGRGEPARFLFTKYGIPFTDERIKVPPLFSLCLSLSRW